MTEGKLPLLSTAEALIVDSLAQNEDPEVMHLYRQYKWSTDVLAFLEGLMALSREKLNEHAPS